MRSHFPFILLLLGLSILFGCEDKTLMNETKSFSNLGWPMNEKVNFPFLIKDTNQTFELAVAIRQSNDYPFHNCYFLSKIYNSKGQVIKQGLAEAYFYHPKTLKSISKNAGSIIGHKYIIFKEMKFSEKGKYTIQIEQYMRKDTLKGIVSVGASIVPIMK
jgi:gliding motility-associated lipoprotein GldH